jgi:hypothetical protein
MKRTVLISASILTLNLGACVLSDKQVGDDEAADEQDTSDDTDEESPETSGDGDGDGEGDGDGDGEPGDSCTDPLAQEDRDCDGLGLACDNAVEHHNPDQLDQDGDDIGDVVDLCVLVAGDSNTADTDRDGIGNACDRCRYTFEHYNDPLEIADPRLWIRNVPSNADFDQDGVGDACDNCVTVANCHGFGPDNPAPHDADADDGDLQNCQSDADLDGIGDACIDADLMQPINGPHATGPVGFGPQDDFDQDGIANDEDGCPRLPVGHGLEGRDPCISDADCESGSRCALTPVNEGQRFCNHRDIDGDFVGDVCDTCPGHANPMQVTDTGMTIDDEDGDFIGAACETNAACLVEGDPRRTGYYDVSVGGQCCVTTYPGDDMLHDPNGVPIRVTCSSEDQEAGICRELPGSAAALPGVVELPLGCEEALAEAGVSEATALTLADVGGDALALWTKACLLPPLDYDFDGIGDDCDLCPFAFDPFNEPYVDDEGALWTTIGEFCAGDYLTTPGAMCVLD